MKDISLSRRAVMLGAAALPIVRKAAAQARPKPVVVSSANAFSGGVNCCAKAMETIKGGGDTLDAVVAGVNIVELDPRDISVGYGGLPNEDGVVELDASCMHGPTRRGGAVGALRGIKTPSKIAQLVLAETEHMMLVGEIGGGLWLDQDVGGAGSTGRGEEDLRVCGAHTVVENMRHGMSPKEAILETLKRVARNFDDDLERLAGIDLSFYAVRKDGEYAGGSLWDRNRPGAPAAQFAVCTADGKSRQEDSISLLVRK